MTKSLLIHLPHPALRQPSRKIGLIDRSILDLHQLMVDQALLWEQDRQLEMTVGLAAVQINRPLKIVLVRQNSNQSEPPQFLTLINPKITKTSGQLLAELEGCLSLPNYYANVQRYERIKIKALDLNGSAFKLQAQGFLARIIQHEIDHLKGLTIVDQASPVTNQAGQTFSFCQLLEDGQFQPVKDQVIEEFR